MASIIKPVETLAGPSRLAVKHSVYIPRRTLTIIPHNGPTPSSSRIQLQRSASTSSKETDWLSWLKNAAILRGTGGNDGGSKALLFAGLVSLLLRMKILMAGLISAHTVCTYGGESSGMGTGLGSSTRTGYDDRIRDERYGGVCRGTEGWKERKSVVEGMGRG